MNREIKFRAKRLDNGEWVYGCLSRYSEAMAYITVDMIENQVYQVDAKTVGQFTNLFDKNVHEIYEGDFVKTGLAINLVEWRDDSCGFEPFSDSKYNCGHCGGADDSQESVIVGNIFDNPELIPEKP